MRSIFWRASISERVDSATRKHLVIEAMRRAYRDRAVYLGDPDFVKMPIAAAHQSRLCGGPALQHSPRQGDAERHACRESKQHRWACRPRISRSSMPPAIAWRGRSPSICFSAPATWCRTPACCSTTPWMISRSNPDAECVRLGGQRRERHRAEQASPVEHDAELRRNAERLDDHRHARRQLHHQHGALGDARLPRTA